MNKQVYHKPIVIPELLKELVHRQIEVNVSEDVKIIDKSKLAQKCYLSSLKLIKSHIVSGPKDPEYENPIEYVQELLISSGDSTKIHKLNRLYYKISNLSLSIPGSNCIRQEGLLINLNKFEDKVLRLLIPLYNTGIGDARKNLDIRSEKDHLDFKFDAKRNTNGSENYSENERSVENVEYRLSSFRNSALLGKVNIDTLRGGETDTNMAEFEHSRDSVLVETFPQRMVNIGNDNLNKKTESGSPSESDDCFASLYALEKVLLSPIQELALVNDILYVLHGFDGQFVKYDVSVDQYVLLPTVHSPVSTRIMVTEICELGVMCRRMNLILKRLDSQLITPYFRDRSTLTGTLIEFSKELVEEHQKFVSGLQSDVQGLISRLSRLETGKNPNKELLTSEIPVLTLRKLLQIMNEQRGKKRKIFAVLEGLFGLNNTSILSGLYIQLHTGDTNYRTIMTELFRRCLSVWLKDLNMLIKEGKTRKHSYFSSNTNVEHSRNMCDEASDLGFFICGNLSGKNGIYMQESLVPVFMSIESAKQILDICKTRSILKVLNPQDKENSSSLDPGLEITPDMILANDNDLKLNSILKQVSELYDSELLNLVVKRDSLLNNLSILRDVFLCLRSDFWELVGDRLSEELNKPSNKVSLQNVQELLQDTMNTFFKEKRGYNKDQNGEGNNPCDFISASLLDLSVSPESGTLDEVSNPSFTGWESFSLKYTFPIRSLSFVLKSSDIMRYERIFKLIWKINSTNQRLNTTWIRITKYLRKNEVNSPFMANLEISERDNEVTKSPQSLFNNILISLRYASCLIRSVILSIDSIKGVIAFDSINSLWEKLVCGVKDALNIKEIRLLHDNYLSGIEFGLFLSSNIINCSREDDDMTSNNQISKLTQDLYLCLDLLLETGIYINKLSSTMLTTANMNDYFGMNEEREDFKEDINLRERNISLLYNFDSEMELCSKNYRNCINSFSKNLSFLISEMQQVAPFSSVNDKLGALQLHLDLFKLLIGRIKQISCLNN